MSTCRNCSTLVSNHHKLCSDCFNNPAVIIYHSEAKKCYGLTDDDLHQANIYREEFESHRQTCFKYLRHEVHELARTIALKPNASNVQSKRFAKMDIQFQQVKKETDELQQKVERTIQCISTLLEKSDVALDIRSQPCILKNIHIQCTNPLIREMEIAVDIMPSCISTATRLKRKKEMNDVLFETFKEFDLKYIDETVDNLTTEYVDHCHPNMSLESITRAIRLHCQHRRTAIDEAIRQFDENIDLPPKSKAKLRVKFISKLDKTCLDPHAEYLACAKTQLELKDRLTRRKAGHRVVRIILDELNVPDDLMEIVNITDSYINGQLALDLDQFQDHVRHIAVEWNASMTQVWQQFETYVSECELTEKQAQSERTELTKLLANASNPLSAYKNFVRRCKIKRTHAVDVDTYSKLFEQTRAFTDKVREEIREPFKRHIKDCTREPSDTMMMYIQRHGNVHTYRMEQINRNFESLAPHIVEQVKASREYAHLSNDKSTRKLGARYHQVLQLIRQLSST